MDVSHESHLNGNLTNPGLQLIRRQLPGRFCLLWFDIRVFYVRITNFTVDDSTPEYLTLSHIPISSETILEVNGMRCSIESKGISCVLRRDRVDKKSEEATFVSTDCIRFTGSVKFEVFDKEDVVISGVLEMSGTNGFVSESNNNSTARKWSMSCESLMNVAGCFSGTPIILTKTMQVNHRKKHRKAIMLPENDRSESKRDEYASGHDLQVAEYRNYKPESEEDYNNLYWRPTEYIEGEDGELSWFNAGVRVGVGIGLGICLGIGIGAGLLVRTYQTTSRTLKRRLG